MSTISAFSRSEWRSAGAGRGGGPARPPIRGGGKIAGPCRSSFRAAIFAQPTETGTARSQRAGGTPAVPSRLHLLRPGHALIAERHRADALVVELLHALTLVGLGRVEVPLGVRCQAVHAVELAGLTPAVAERGDLLKRLAHNNAHPL